MSFWAIWNSFIASGYLECSLHTIPFEGRMPLTFICPLIYICHWRYWGVLKQCCLCWKCIAYWRLLQKSILELLKMALRYTANCRFKPLNEASEESSLLLSPPLPLLQSDQVPCTVMVAVVGWQWLCKYWPTVHWPGKVGPRTPAPGSSPVHWHGPGRAAVWWEVICDSLAPNPGHLFIGLSVWRGVWLHGARCFTSHQQAQNRIRNWNRIHSDILNF